jgi:hypothetical protein
VEPEFVEPTEAHEAHAHLVSASKKAKNAARKKR